MNIAVVDDSPTDTVRMQQLFTCPALEKFGPLAIDYYSSGQSLLESPDIEKYHLILMDIYMEGPDGIETARILQKRAEEALIAFLTSSSDDIWRAVSTHGCFDYIRKDTFDEPRLEKLLADAKKRWDKRERALTFSCGAQTISVPFCKIQYVAARDKHVCIVLKNGRERLYRVTFASMEPLLEPEENFLLCNRGVYLNMDFIQKTDGESFEMKDGTCFPIRRRSRAQALEAFYDYQFRQLREG
ncbi:MAG: response regulator [Eubacteriales bacterium]|nr:response regulator [Eubacteriales bacterium]